MSVHGNPNERANLFTRKQAAVRAATESTPIVSQRARARTIDMSVEERKTRQSTDSNQ